MEVREGGGRGREGRGREGRGREGGGRGRIHEFLRACE
jgi:hypothetical protein